MEMSSSAGLKIILTTIWQFGNCYLKAGIQILSCQTSVGVVEVLLCSWGISSLSGIIFVIPEYNGHCASFKYPMATIDEEKGVSRTSKSRMCSTSPFKHVRLWVIYIYANFLGSMKIR